MTPHDEVRLLLSILRRRFDAAAELTRGRSVNPERFVELCVRADVPAWVLHLLETDDAEHVVAGAVLERLRPVRARMRRDNLLLLARAEQALDLLSRAGVHPVALKGLDLLHRTYPAFDLRTLDDVDLLVRREELPVAVEALERGGFVLPPEPRRTHYVRSSHHLPLAAPGPIPVEFELHWNLAQETRYRIDAASLHARATPLSIGGRPALGLSAPDLVAHLLLHQLAHYFDRRLKWAVDLHLVSSAPGFDWMAVVARLAEWDARATGAAALTQLARLFPEWIPAEVRHRLPLAAWRRVALRPLRGDHPLDWLRGTRRRAVQLWIAAALLDRPLLLPRWVVWRAVRDRRQGANPLDRS